MPDQKITQLNELASLESTDLLAVVDDPEGSPETKKMPVSLLSDLFLLLAGGTLGGELTTKDIIVPDNQKLYMGTGKDGEIYSSGDNLYIENVTSDKDVIFRVNDGGVTTEVMRFVGSTGRVGINDPSPTKRLSVVEDMMVKGASNSSYPSLTFYSYSTTGWHSGFFQSQRSRDGGSVASGDYLFDIKGMGHDGASLLNSCELIFKADTGVGAGVIPGRINLKTVDTVGTPNLVLDLRADKSATFYGKIVSAADTLRITASKTPASAGAAGNAGDICWDASYIYVCVATNTWKRAAIATW